MGSEFVEMFQGVAATRIRNLFKAARATAPSIVFIGTLLSCMLCRTAALRRPCPQLEAGVLEDCTLQA